MDWCEHSANPPPHVVRAQVTRILASEGFLRSLRMQRFLTFIVEETIAGRQDQLAEYAIGMAVYDRGPDFEPALDPIVRNDARRLRNKLMEYYGSGPERGAGEVVIEVPRGGYVPSFQVQRTQAGQGAAVRPAIRLAVFPFDILCARPDAVVQAQAIRGSLTAALTQVRGAEVVAHGYLESRPLHVAAMELRLTHAMQGTILQGCGQYRVVLHLVQISDGTQLWAAAFDFDPSEMLEAHSAIAGVARDEVVGRVARAVRPEGLPQAA